MENKTIKVLCVEPGKHPYEKEIDSGLRSLQQEVGGDIEAVYPFEDPCAIVCAEEGKLLQYDLNRALRDEDGQIYDIVAGTFLIVGLGEEDFTSLSPELMKKYEKEFHAPEMFMRMGGHIQAFKMGGGSRVADDREAR